MKTTVCLLFCTCVRHAFAWKAHRAAPSPRLRSSLVSAAASTARALAIRCGDNTADRPQSLRNHSNNTVDGFTLLSDTVLHDKWRRLTRRAVQLPHSKSVVDFEIVGQSANGNCSTDQAVLIFVWNTVTKTTTLIREYMPATHCKMYGLAAGMVEADKHGGTGIGSSSTTGDDDRMQQTAAAHELEEECRLVGGTWIRLTPKVHNAGGGGGVTMDKYSTTKLTAYLVLDPYDAPGGDQAKPRDATEEGMEVVPDISIWQLRHLLDTGQLTVVGSWACLLALQKLRDIGEIHT